MLIQEGGYVSPDTHLWEDVLISVVLKKPDIVKRAYRFRENETCAICLEIF